MIVHTWGIGDWLFFTPVIKALMVKYPSLKIDVILGTPSTKQIVELYPEVKIKAITDVRKGLVGILKAAVKTWRTKYDAVIFTAGVDSRKADKLASLIKAKRKIALRTRQHNPRFLSDVAQYNPCIHRVENNLKVLDMLEIERPKEPNPFLPFTTLQKVKPDSILIHPGSDKVNSFKRWSAERFAAVAEILLNQSWNVSIILGPDEDELLTYFECLKKHNRFKTHINLPLPKLLDVIRSYNIFLNTDSGLGHLASALGVKTVTIFGPGDPTQIRPYGEKCTIVKTSQELHCMPCMRSDGMYGCKERTCLTDIGVEEVLNTIIEER